MVFHSDNGHIDRVETTKRLDRKERRDGWGGGFFVPLL